VTATVLLVRWARGWHEVVNTGAVSSLGRSEDSLALGAQETLAEVERVAHAQLGQVAREAIEVDLVPTTPTDTPYAAFMVADTVTVPTSAGADATERVVALTVAEDENGHLTWAPELRDLILTQQERFEQAIARMGRGAMSGTSSVATPVPNETTPQPIAGGGGGGGPEVTVIYQRDPDWGQPYPEFETGRLIPYHQDGTTVWQIGDYGTPWADPVRIGPEWNKRAHDYTNDFLPIHGRHGDSPHNYEFVILFPKLYRLLSYYLSFEMPDGGFPVRYWYSSTITTPTTTGDWHEISLDHYANDDVPTNYATKQSFFFFPTDVRAFRIEYNTGWGGSGFRAFHIYGDEAESPRAGPAPTDDPEGG
jgi:hypothetical protein